MFSDPQFWVAVAFFLFIIAVFNPIRKILTTSLDQKINEISNNIDEAENLKDEAMLTLSEIKQRQNEVQKEIEIIKNDAINKVANIEKDSYEKIKDNIKKKQFLASAKIEQIVRDTNFEIQNYISSTAIAATIKLLEKKLDIDAKQKLINNSINELDSILKN